jgi:hypothetical protein
MANNLDAPEILPDLQLLTTNPKVPADTEPGITPVYIPVSDHRRDEAIRQ